MLKNNKRDTSSMESLSLIDPLKNYLDRKEPNNSITIAHTLHTPATFKPHNNPKRQIYILIPFHSEETEI